MYPSGALKGPIFPFVRRKFSGLVVGHRWKLSEDVGEVGLGFDAVSLAGFQDSIDDRAFMSCCGMADEQPVLGAEFAGADALLGQIVIDAGLGMVEVNGEFVPLSQGVVDGFPEGGAGADDLTVFL